MKVLSTLFLLFLSVMFLALTQMHPTAQDAVTVATPTDTGMQSEIVGALLTIITALLGGGFAIVLGFIYSLYKSVPVAFQSAFLDVTRGIVATLAESAQKQADNAKATDGDLDDRIWGAVLEALETFGVDMDSLDDEPPVDEKPKDGV
jgi:hypothetical protein